MRRSCWRFSGNAYPRLVAATMLVLPMGQPTANPYSQVFLGFRALAVKLLIFVIMAALLAWAIGGTLWPRTTIRQIGDGVEVGGKKYQETKGFTRYFACDLRWQAKGPKKRQVL